MDTLTFAEILKLLNTSSPYLIFAALFLYLFINTRKEDHDREIWARGTIEQHDKTLLVHIDLIKEVARLLASNNERLDRIERHVDQIADRSEEKPRKS